MAKSIEKIEVGKTGNLCYSVQSIMRASKLSIGEDPKKEVIYQEDRTNVKRDESISKYFRDIKNVLGWVMFLVIRFVCFDGVLRSLDDVFPHDKTWRARASRE